MRQMRILVGMKVNEEEGCGDRGGCPVKMIGLIKELVNNLFVYFCHTNKII